MEFIVKKLFLIGLLHLIAAPLYSMSLDPVENQSRIQRAVVSGDVNELRNVLYQRLPIGDCSLSSFLVVAPNVEIAELLIDSGADVNQLTCCEVPSLCEAPLHAAARMSMPVVELILKMGGNPNLQDSWGRTPLRTLLIAKHVDTQKVALLLQHGADPLMPDNHDFTVLELAQSRNCCAGVVPLLDYHVQFSSLRNKPEAIRNRETFGTFSGLQ
jgi:hypothetical protein